MDEPNVEKHSSSEYTSLPGRYWPGVSSTNPSSSAGTGAG